MDSFHPIMDGNNPFIGYCQQILERSILLSGEQIRAARGILGWSQSDLAEKSSVGLTTIRRFEARDGLVSGTVDSVHRIQRALEEGGAVFLPEDQQFGVGVRLAKPRQA